MASPWCSVIKRKGCSDRGCQIMGMIQSTCSGCRYFIQLKQRNLLPIHLLIAVLLCSPEMLHQCLSVQHKRLVILKVELVFTNIPLVHLAILVQYCIMVMRCLVWLADFPACTAQQLQLYPCALTRCLYSTICRLY